MKNKHCADRVPNQAPGCEAPRGVALEGEVLQLGTGPLEAPQGSPVLRGDRAVRKSEKVGSTPPQQPTTNTLRNI